MDEAVKYLLVLSYVPYFPGRMQEQEQEQEHEHEEEHQVKIQGNKPLKDNDLSLLLALSKLWRSLFSMVARVKLLA